MSECALVDFGARRRVLLAETLAEGASSTLPSSPGCRVDELSEIHQHGPST